MLIFEFIGGTSYLLALKRESISTNDELQVILLGPQIEMKKEYI